MRRRVSLIQAGYQVSLVRAWREHCRHRLEVEPWALTRFVAKGEALKKTGGMSDLKSLILDFGRRARAAARQLARLSAAQKNAGLLAMADEILAAQSGILAANAR